MSTADEFNEHMANTWKNASMAMTISRNANKVAEHVFHAEHYPQDLILNVNIWRFPDYSCALVSLDGQHIYSVWQGVEPQSLVISEDDLARIVKDAIAAEHPNVHLNSFMIARYIYERLPPAVRGTSS